MEPVQPAPSLFAQMVDKLRNKSEGELKMLYLKFFSADLKAEWNEITDTATFNNVTEEDIIKAIQQKRYNK